MKNTVVIRGPKHVAKLPHDTWESAFETYQAIVVALDETDIVVELYDADGEAYSDNCILEMPAELPPTPGYNKLKSPARAAARSRAKAFYPFD